LIIEVVPNSPAAQAGLRNGDVITKIDSQEVMTPDDLRRAVMQAAVGQRVNLGIMRANNQRELTAQLDQAPANFGPPAGQPRYYGGFDQSSQEIQRLQQRIQQLEKRLRALEQNQQTPRDNIPR
jgi:C-terminal processing protease CtpA/Prc